MIGGWIGRILFKFDRWMDTQYIMYRAARYGERPDQLDSVPSHPPAPRK